MRTETGDEEVQNGDSRSRIVQRAGRTHRRQCRCGAYPRAAHAADSIERYRLLAGTMTVVLICAEGSLSLLGHPPARGRVRPHGRSTLLTVGSL